MKKKLEKWMNGFWGERCPDYNKNCPLCKAWDCFDYLTEDDDEE